jgi:hypothetical protein
MEGTVRSHVDESALAMHTPGSKSCRIVKKWKINKRAARVRKEKKERNDKKGRSQEFIPSSPKKRSVQ